MNSYELGKRIREARLAKKMTQSELVGDFITRNMLSRIESGNACPSVKTLEYLAQRLELPPGSLISDEALPESESNESDLLLKAKQLYISKDYDNATDIALQLETGCFSDEAIAILARCYLERAKQAADKKEYGMAAKLAGSAMDYSDEGIYKSREITTEATLLLRDIAAKAMN